MEKQPGEPGFKPTVRMRFVWSIDYFLCPAYIDRRPGGWLRFLVTGGAAGLFVLALLSGFDSTRFYEMFPVSHVILALIGYPLVLVLQQAYWLFRKHWRTPTKHSWEEYPD